MGLKRKKSEIKIDIIKGIKELQYDREKAEQERILRNNECKSYSINDREGKLVTTGMIKRVSKRV